MREPNRREQAVAWQQKWITPILVVVAVIAVVAATAAGGVPWWLGVIIAAFGVLTLVSLVRQRSTGSR